MFEDQKYEDTKSILEFLARLHPRCHEVRYSSGLCCERLGKIEDALYSYVMAITTYKENPSPYIFGAEICVRQGNFTDAKVFLDLMATCVASEVFSACQEKVEKIKKQIS